MTSQAVYCLSLQIRPPTEEGTNVVATSSGNDLTKVVTTASTPVTAPGGAIITGLDSKSVTLTEAATRQLQTQIHLQQAQTQTAAAHPQHSNIILVRGSRSENGQIILQNTHELLSLLSDEDKPILLQHQRLKTKTVPEVTATAATGNTILFQPAIKSNAVDGTFLLQSDGGLKKTALTTDGGGPIFLQQRLNKNGSSEGPILLRTLKRIDKSQSILVIRNATTTASTAGSVMAGNASSNSASTSVAGPATTATIVKAKPIQIQQQQQQQLIQPATATSTTATVVTVSSGGASNVAVAEEIDSKKEATPPVKIVQKPINLPLGTDGEPIKLPENLESLPRADHFPTQRHRWNTNEEIAAILISFDKHSEWQSKEVKTRPKSGSMLLYSRKKVRYRRDGYCWKKRKDGKTTREDHMKLKVQGTECIYGCYVHSAILPTFHRRCYWLLQNPDIVLVHYLNVPYPDDNKMAVITPNLALWGDKKEWTKEELVSQLKPMFFPAVFSEDEPDATNEIEISTAETVEAIVSQLMEKQRMARQSALVKQLECGCPDANCVDGKSCSHPMRRISAAKSDMGKRPDGGHLGGTAPNVLIGSRLQGNPGSLLILNGQQQSFVCHPSQQQQHLLQQHKSLVDQSSKNGHLSSSSSSGTSSNGSANSSIKMENSPSDGSQHNSSLIPKQEIMESSSSPSSSSMATNHHTVGAGPTKQFESMFGGYAVRHSPSGGNGHHDHLPFFNETLDLSQEDIQKTLSANMPLGHNHGAGGVGGGQSEAPADDAMNGEINPMDFIENCGEAHDPVDDDVFVNLDAFDMLVEFPELELDAKSAFLNGSETGTEAGGEIDDGASDLSHFKLSADSGIVVGDELTGQHPSESTITDFSPEWAYPEGGIKVLVTGPWSTASSYTVLFDSFPVPTTLVQNGVLRCYCPAHEVGVVTLQVACDGYVISNGVNFEYKSPPKFETKCEGNGNDMLYKFNLLTRLESIDEKLQIKVEPGELPEESVMFKQANFEERLVTYCQTLTAKMWRSVTPGSWIGKHRGMTLLHLASALGYPKLVRTMLTWKTENSNVILEAEIDALSQDQEGFTPLMWACSRGHVETALVLYKWNQNALNVKNCAHESPLEVAKNRGFPKLAAELEKHEFQRIQSKISLATTSASLSTLASITSSSYSTSSSSTLSTLASSASADSSSVPSSTTSLTNPSTILANSNSSRNSGHGRRDSCRSATADLAHDNSNNGNDTEGNNHPEVSPEHNFINDLFNYNEALNSNNSDSCSNDNFALSSSYNPSLSPAALSPYSDIKGSCSSMGSGQIGSSTAAAGALHYALENNNSNPMLSNALSPNSDSNRSHDGVFLRPGAVFSSGQSPPGARLSKRSSIDSGINMETRSISKSGKSLRDVQRINRNDRSMSLPLAAGSSGGYSSPFGGSSTNGSNNKSSNNSDSDNFSLSLNDRATESPSQASSNLSNSSLLSPLRKMDFALCEVSAARSSPMCEDTDSLQEDERHSSTVAGRVVSSSSSTSAAVAVAEALIGSVSSFGAGQGHGMHHLLHPSGGTHGGLHHYQQQQQQQQQHLQEGGSGSGAVEMMVTGGGGGTATGAAVGESDVKVLTLAEQIIAAMPERIKNESEEIMSQGSPMPETLSEDSSGMGILSDSFMEPLLDPLSSSQLEEFNFEYSDHNYRYHDVGTPCSSLSPASSGPLQSPASYSIPQDQPVSSPSPPPTTQDFTEFLQSTNSNPFEKDFSNLKLTDREQRELYEAAKCIQKAYRSYKGRKSRMEEQDKERSAAVVIQNYYRRYKQYAYYRQMTQAAVIIQNGYRSYCENKRFKKALSNNQSGHLRGTVGSGESAEEAASSSQCIQSYYKNFKNEQQKSPQQNNQGSPKEPSPSGPLKRTYSQRTQNQAARKIQQFMRQSKNNTWDEQMTNLAAERTSRKREAGPPTQGGVPPKLAVPRSTGSTRSTAYQRSKVN
ncbi:uncharacterized protein LOC134218497 isoform X5 [Armigeres subalbatus]|uniref:uncharacterized protein LOC134218497 isoform X5 n=1 Tax=Armigeres subalbatus TaxID=124917 RepID=UPI002ED04BB1